MTLTHAEVAAAIEAGQFIGLLTTVFDPPKDTDRFGLLAELSSVLIGTELYSTYTAEIGDTEWEIDDDKAVDEDFFATVAALAIAMNDDAKVTTRVVGALAATQPVDADSPDVRDVERRLASGEFVASSEVIGLDGKTNIYGQSRAVGVVFKYDGGLCSITLVTYPDGSMSAVHDDIVATQGQVFDAMLEQKALFDDAPAGLVRHEFRAGNEAEYEFYGVFDA